MGSHFATFERHAPCDTLTSSKSRWQNCPSGWISSSHLSAPVKPRILNQVFACLQAKIRIKTRQERHLLEARAHTLPAPLLTTQFHHLPPPPSTPTCPASS